MTPQETLKSIEKQRNEFGFNGNLYVTVDEYYTIKQALEKQIPKRPDYEGDGYDDKGNLINDTWICPCCEKPYEIDYEEYDHCPNCGQAIDLSEVQDD